MPWAARDDAIDFRVVSSLATTLQLYALLRLPNGKLDWKRTPPLVTTVDRATNVVRIRNLPEGEIVDATVGIVRGSVPSQPGQTYVEARLFHGGGTPVQTFLAGKLYDHHDPSLGAFESPLDGRGNLDWVQIANDVAGDTTTTHNLAVTGARRVYHDVLWKYHCDATMANRTLDIFLRDLADTSGPTGFSIVADVWNSTDLVLSANEDGINYIGKDGFQSLNDNGTLTYIDNTTVPHPFPLTVEEGDTGDLVFSATLGEAGDDYDIWLLIEEWVHA